MSNFKVFSITVFMYICITACSNKKDTTKEEITDIKPEVLKVLHPDETILNDNEVMDLKSSISLDSSETALLGEVSKAFEIDHEYYLLDPIYSVIKIFDKKGIYKRSIGKIGAGPGEYTRLYDADFDTTDSTFLLYSNDGRTLNRYTLQGKFMEKKTMPFYAYYFMISPNSNSYYFYINYNSSEVNERHNLLETDRDMKVLKKLFPYTKDEINAFAYTGKISKNKQGLLYANALEDTIYQLTATQTYPKYIFDFESYSCPVDLKENTSMLHKILVEKAYLNSDFLESESVLFFSFAHKRRNNKGFYLRKSKKFILTKNLKENTLLNLMSVPMGLTPNGDFISIIRPEVVNAYLEDDRNYLEGIKNQFPELYKRLVNLKEGSNSVLITFSVKE